MSYKKDETLKSRLEIAIQNTISMRGAASLLKMNYATFSKYAKLFGLWKSNKGLRGGTRGPTQFSTKLHDILEGKHPTYQTNKLKDRLIKAKIKKNECEKCYISSWMGDTLKCHLDHINGNPWDHRLNNLRILCPNCHSQTPTYCNKKRSNLADFV